MAQLVARDAARSEYDPDLEAAAAAAATPIVHPPGTELNLTIQVGKGGSVIRTKAIVRWHRSTNDESEQPLGVGVEFIGMNDTDAARIAAFVKNREQTEAASDDD